MLQHLVKILTEEVLPPRYSQKKLSLQVLQHLVKILTEEALPPRYEQENLRLHVLQYLGKFFLITHEGCIQDELSLHMQQGLDMSPTGMLGRYNKNNN